MITLRAFVTGGLALLAGCLPGSGDDDEPKGTAYVHFRKMSGVCPVRQIASDYGDPCPSPSALPPGTVCGLDQIRALDIPYESIHAVAARTAGSMFAGGNLLASAWETETGELSRLYLDVSGGHGLSAGPFPYTFLPNWTQSIGYSEWRDGVATFKATGAFGGMTWANAMDANGATVNDALDILFHFAFNGTDQNGAAACRIIGIHADTGHARDMSYDPTWLVANPAVMFAPEGTAPTYAGDSEPGHQRMTPAQAGPDPGGTAPELPLGTSVCEYLSNCGGAGGCG